MAAYIPANPEESPKLILTFPNGLNLNQTPDISEAADGYNFELNASQSLLAPRAPFDLKGTAPNAGAVTGICQLVKRSNAQTTLVFAGNTCYLWDGGSTWTSKGTITAGGKMRDSYWSLGDYIVITDVSANLNNVKMWDGTTFQDLPTGLASNTFSAKYAIVHLSRVWFFNVTYNGSATPHMIVASAFENPQSLNISARGGPANLGGSTFSTGLEAFYVLSPDLKAINGVSLFQGVLIISTVSGQLFSLTGTNSSNFAFTPFTADTSAIGTEAMLNVGNEVTYISLSGNINLMQPTQYFGNVISTNMSWWITPLVENLADAIIVYEQINQKVYYFVKNYVLVLYKDIAYGVSQVESAMQANTKLSPWSKYITSHTNQFNTSAARYMYIPGTTNYSTYFGDSSGNVFDINGTGSGDGGLYNVGLSRVSRLIDETVINPFPWNEEILIGKLQYWRNFTATTVEVQFSWTDEYNTSSSQVPLKGPATNSVGVYWNKSSYWGGSAYWSQGGQFAGLRSHQTFSPTGKGTGVYITISSQSLQPWQMDHIELY